MSLGKAYIDFILEHNDVMQLLTSDNRFNLSRIEILFIMYINNRERSAPSRSMLNNKQHKQDLQSPSLCQPKVTMGDLSSFFNLPQSSTLFTVNKLIKLGYVKRDRSEEDRRVVHVELTDEGKSIISDLVENTSTQFLRIIDLLGLKIKDLLKEEGPETAKVLDSIFEKIKNL